MKHILNSLLLTFIFVLSACAPIATAIQPTQIVNTPTIAVPTEVFQPMNAIKISAPSLKENLVGEAAERTIQVYLPPSYGIQNNRFPVIYYLPGYGDSGMIGFNLPDSMDRLVNGGSLQRLSSKCAWRTYSRLHAAIFLNHIEIWIVSLYSVGCLV